MRCYPTIDMLFSNALLILKAGIVPVENKREINRRRRKKERISKRRYKDETREIPEANPTTMIRPFHAVQLVDLSNRSPPTGSYLFIYQKETNNKNV